MSKIKKIIYVSSDRNPDSNSQIRYKNFKKIYPNTIIFYSSHDLKKYDLRRFRANRNINSSIYKIINENFISLVKEFKPNLIWLDKNLTLTYETIEYLKSKYPFFLISFTNDNPFSHRPAEKKIWIEYLKNLKLCDIVFIAQINQIKLYKKYKVKKIVRYLHAIDYDFIDITNIGAPSNIIRFIGNCEYDRIKLVKTIFQNIDNFEVYGPNWNRFLTNYSLLFSSKIKKPIWNRTIYINTIQKSLACLNLLSKTNNDEIANRIFEITSCGGLALSEKNSQISQIFGKDDVLFYESTEDLISKCKYINTNPHLSSKYKFNAFNKIKSLNLDYKFSIERWLNYLDNPNSFIDEFDRI